MDAIYEYSPGLNGSTPSLGTKFLATDDIEKSILNEITGVPINLDTKNTCFGGDKKKEELFFTFTMQMTDSLFKANNHRKNYKKKENKIVKKFKKDALSDPNTTIDIKLNPIELFNELDGFLTDTKSTLDTVAQALGLLLGTSFNGWHKGKNENGETLSGIPILNALKRNIPKEQSDRINDLYEHIKSKINWISFLVSLRDQPVHQGGLKNVSHLVFSRGEGKVIKQYVSYPNGKKEKVKEFIDKTIQEIVIFINELIVLAIQYKSPNLQIIRTIEPNGYPKYSWKILNLL